MEVNVTDKERVRIGEDLSELGGLVGTAEVTLMGLEVIAHNGGFDFSPIKKRTDEIIELLSDATAKHRTLSANIYRTGLPLQPAAKQEPKIIGNELALLSTIGSDDSRELLAVLEHAQQIAERIDASRGFVVDEKIPLQPGESRGTDLAESLSMLALRVRREATGGQSRHE
jgi:hypothetical protein